MGSLHIRFDMDASQVIGSWFMGVNSRFYDIQVSHGALSDKMNRGRTEKKKKLRKKVDCS